MNTAGDADIHRSTDGVTMRKELFGVFGGSDDFTRFRDRRSFDAVFEGAAATVGVRTPGLGVPGRSSVYDGDAGGCAVFGEVVPPSDVSVTASRRLCDRFAERGVEAFDALNGAYLAFVESDGAAVVATDPIRSWECFYADIDGVRVFGTDITSVIDLLSDHAVDRRSVLELLHLGTVLGEATLFDSIRRVPFDSYLTESGVESLDRFVYDPREFDYIGELAECLQRAIASRSHYSGRKGLLLSGGKDSRVFLSQLPEIDATYTIGDAESREVRVAMKVAAQYDAMHTVLEPSFRYLYPSDEKLLYGQSVKEALHIHHAGYDHEFDVDVMYHGLLFDTLLKGYFLERDGISVFGSTLPSNSLVSDPEPVECLLDTLGYLPEGSRRLAGAVSGQFEDLDLDIESPRDFLRDRLQAELETCWERTDSPYNAMDLLIIKNQPVLPFRTHLADNYFESFVSVDSALLAWHLRTPPEYRNAETFRRALIRIDEDILRHRPPSQPHISTHLNEVERFVRRKMPFVEQFEPAWPDRQEVYEEYRLDAKLFPHTQSVHELPARQQLRVNDVRWWLSRE